MPLILNTSRSTGIPQNRERAYIVCFLNDNTYVDIPIPLVDENSILKANQSSFDLNGNKTESFLNNLKKNILEEKNNYKDFLENLITSIKSICIRTKTLKLVRQVVK